MCLKILRALQMCVQLFSAGAQLAKQSLVLAVEAYRCGDASLDQVLFFNLALMPGRSGQRKPAPPFILTSCKDQLVLPPTYGGQVFVVAHSVVRRRRS